VRLTVRPESLGQKVRCPRCARILAIPAPPPVAVPAAGLPPPAAGPQPAPVATTEADPKTPPRPRWLHPVAVVLGLLLVAGGGFLLYRHLRSPPSDPSDQQSDARKDSSDKKEPPDRQGKPADSAPRDGHKPPKDKPSP